MRNCVYIKSTSTLNVEDQSDSSTDRDETETTVSPPYSDSSVTSYLPPPTTKKNCSSSTHIDSRPKTPPQSNRKLRRKVPIADTLNVSTVNQRLVEYFVIVSSKPRWTESDGHKKNKSRFNKSGNSTQSQDESPLLAGEIPVHNEKMKTDQQLHQQQVSPSVGATITTGATSCPETRQPESCVGTKPNIVPDHANQNDGNIHMPDQPASANEVEEQTFQPVITARYPCTDHDDNPLNPMILQFCYPTTDLIVPVIEYEMPRVHHFVLTLGCGRKLYATCLTVLEEWVPSEHQHHHLQPRCVNTQDFGSDGIELSMTGKDEEQEVRYIPKVLCLLSTWPYLTAFREYLCQLYRLASTTDVMKAPLERYILNICCEIPAPPPGAYEIQLPILDSIIRFWAPPAKLPIAYVALPYHILFECLDLDHVLTVWTAIILERRVLLLSSQCSILTVIAEILVSLIFPLRWSHLFVPLLPRMLCPMLDAPVPYLCGIVRENWLHAQQFVSDETIVVDLDRNMVQFAANVPDLPPMPTRKWTKLQVSLTTCVGDVFWKARGLEDAYMAMMQKKPHKRSLEQLRQRQRDGGDKQWNEKLLTLDHAFNLAYTPESLNLPDIGICSVEQQSRWDKVQEAFLRFFVALLRDYRKYLNIPTSASNNKRPSFDHDEFLAGLRADNVLMVTELCKTQQFDDFLTRRMYSPGEPDLVFFDQSIDAKLNRSKLKIKKLDTPFLHSARAHKELTKLDAVPPNLEGINNTNNNSYVYKTLPECFDNNLFCEPRPIPCMISAEFNRQDVLVSKLRAYIVEEEEEGGGGGGDVNGNPSQFFSADYDTSPEVAAFTVFFFVYSSLVGQEWQKYDRKRLDEKLALTQSEMTNGSTCILGERRDGAVVGDCGCARESLLGNVDQTDEIQKSLDCCSGCIQGDPLGIDSTIAFIKGGTQDVFTTYFRRPVEQVVRDLSFNVQDNALPTTDAGLVEYEEARENAAAELEVAFETLATMRLRGLPVDNDAYLSLMQACGRCGDTDRAIKLIESMKKDAFVADSDVLACFISAFVHNNAAQDDPATRVEVIHTDRLDADAFSRLIGKTIQVQDEDVNCKLISMHPSYQATSQQHDQAVYPDGPIDDSSCSEVSSTGFSTFGSPGLLDWVHQYPFECKQTNKKTKRKKKGKKRLSCTSKSSTGMPISEYLSRHLALGESLLDVIYPDLNIDTNSDACPHCSNTLNENEIVAGWKPCAFTDYTTKCPQCQHRFVPHFVVTTSEPLFEGSQGPGTPLFCEFLSPWVLRKEFQHIINSEHGIEKVLSPQWRVGSGIRATLFWNLIAICRRYKLSFTFLLQGNFSNRLILPRSPEQVDKK